MQEYYRLFNQLLDQLGIESGDLIYLHTSFKRMGYLALTGEQLLDALVERLGPNGTLVLPSFAWNLDKTARPWKGYQEFFDARPVFDVRNTPANIGWLPELFRTMDDVKRSQNYFWPICARGRLASEVTADQEKIAHPYGAESSFDRLRIHGVKILGLGVSLNTTSLALVPDYALGQDHPQELFTDKPQLGTLIDYHGKEIVTRSIWLLPEVVRQIKPSVLIEESRKLRDSVLRADRGSTINFSYPFSSYYEEAIRLGREAGAANQAVPWLRDYSLKRNGLGTAATSKSGETATDRGSRSASVQGGPDFEIAEEKS